MKTIGAVFLNTYAAQKEASTEYPSNVYSFKTVLDVVEGDHVAVECSAGMTICRVVSVHDVPSKKATKWAFAKIDTTVLDELQKTEAEREKLVSALKAKVMARKEIEIYEQIAASDPDAKSMLERIAEIDRGFAQKTIA
jgi:hypothetical protein